MSNYIQNLVKTAGWKEVKQMFDDAVVEMVESLKEGFSSGNLSFIYDTFYENISQGIQDGLSATSMIDLSDYIQGQSDSVVNMINSGDIAGAVRVNPTNGKI